MTLVEALRCSASVKPIEKNCADCKYRWLEPVHSDFPCPTEVVIEGVEYWQSCDVDQIVFDAADALERLGYAD